MVVVAAPLVPCDHGRKPMVKRDRKQRNFKLSRHVRAVLEEVADTLAKRTGYELGNMSETMELALHADDEIARMIPSIAARYTDALGWIENATPEVNCTLSPEAFEIIEEFTTRYCLAIRHKRNRVKSLNAIFEGKPAAWALLAELRTERARKK